MKKPILCVLILLSILSLQSCATVFGGHISACQKNKPATGSRQVRPVALVADICTGAVWLAIDFADGAIYKPCKKNVKDSVNKNSSNNER